MGKVGGVGVRVARFWIFDFGLGREKNAAARFARAAAPGRKPFLKKFVRRAPFLGAVAFLLHKKVPRRLTARGRTGDSPPAGAAVIVPGGKSPHLRAAGRGRSERRIQNHHPRAAGLAEATRGRFGRWLVDGAVRGLLAASCSGRLTVWRPPATQPTTSTRSERDKRLSRRMSTPSR
jgi:hypothetical protein